MKKYVGKGTDYMVSLLQEKSKAFALVIIKICNEIKQYKRESIRTNQLLRSGTSIGATIREPFYAHGKADFLTFLASLNLGSRFLKVIGNKGPVQYFCMVKFLPLPAL